MRLIISLFILCMSISSFSQEKENRYQTYHQTVFFTKNTGDSIRVTAEVEDASADSAIITVDLIKFGNSKRLQIFKLGFYFPLDINLACFDNQKGITYKYDPRISNGNRYLFLFNEKTGKLQEVRDFIKLGMIKEISINKQNYYFSYSTCGCADACWKSILFKVKSYQIDTLSLIRCDCENLILKSKKTREKKVGNCETFNNNEKFDNIKKYWTEKINNGL